MLTRFSEGVALAAAAPGWVAASPDTTVGATEGGWFRTVCLNFI